MLLEVVATRIGGATTPYTLEVADDSTWTCKDAGGWHEGTFTAKEIPSELRPEMGGARVMLQGAEKPVFFGRVIGLNGNTINCQGFYHELGEHQAGGCYSSSTLSDWRGSTSNDRFTDVNMSEEWGVLRFIWTAGTTYAAYSYNGSVIDIPPAGTGTLTFGWSRASTAFYYIAYTGVYNPSATDGDCYTWTAIEQQPTTGALTGTSSISLPGSYDAVKVVAACSTALTPTADTAYAFTNLRLTSFGLTAPVTASAILGKLLDVLPEQPVRQIAATTTDVADFRIEHGASAFEGVSKLLALQDYSLTTEPRLVSGIYKPGIVFRANDPTPYYTAVIDGTEITADLEPVDWSALASRVLVRYKTPTGRSAALWVTDTDATHYLVCRGITKDAAIDVDTTSVTVAANAGTSWLGQIGGVAPVSGTVTVSGALNGEMPANIEPGRWIRLISGQGAMTGRIREVRHVGLYKAVLTLNNTLTLDDILRGGVSVKPSGWNGDVGRTMWHGQHLSVADQRLGRRVRP